MICYFCPGGHNDLLFLSRGSFCFLFLSGGSLWTIVHVQGGIQHSVICPGGKILKIIVQGVHPKDILLSRGLTCFARICHELFICGGVWTSNGIAQSTIPAGPTSTTTILYVDSVPPQRERACFDLGVQQSEQSTQHCVSVGKYWGKHDL